jgi:uncharacterized protein DUF6580
MKKQTPLEFASVIALIVVAVAYRVILGTMANPPGWLPNFSPVAAIALCGAIFLPKRIGLALPIAILFVSDLILNRQYGASIFELSMLVRYVSLAALAAVGLWFRSRPNPVFILAGSAGGSVAFYLTTNTASWLALAEYPKNFAGWAQALTVGLPGYAPTWIFFRNSIISDLLFTALIILCMPPVREKDAGQRALAHG